ncbi:unnamed protein product [Moneuplotes crassus]|uniref:TAFII55 protein conserved region domain-containing protein n=1 Tax=Euplotes crassus TaxID=5936 RepID=A0AAD2CVW4_EUPCR|nr:unnamed protein product [Moneuplotes crassus]
MIDISAFNGREKVDEGFILRANDEVSDYIRDFIKTGHDRTSLELIHVEDRKYGLVLGNIDGLEPNGYIYYCTLCDLPTISEAQNTLDMKTFNKSADISQVIYVHPNKVSIEEIEDIASFIKNEMPEFDPFYEDPDFLEQLYDRTSYKKKIQVDKNDENSNKILLFGNAMDEPNNEFLLRDGLTPATKNIVNVRYKKDVKENKEDIAKVEEYLKDNIDLGFSENAVEELLTFDKEGNLVKKETIPDFDPGQSEMYSSNYEDQDFSVKMKI